MAYSAVPTANTGDVAWSADYVNTYIKNNFAAGVPAIFTTAGDLAVATGAEVAARFGIGTDGYVLMVNTANANKVEWRSPFDGGHIYTSPGTSQTQTVVTEGSYTKVLPITELFDQNGNAEGSNSRYVCEFSGKHLIFGGTLVVWTAGAPAVGEEEALAVYINGSLSSVLATEYPETIDVTSIWMHGADILDLNAGDIVEIYCKAGAVGDTIKFGNFNTASANLLVVYLGG